MTSCLFPIRSCWKVREVGPEVKDSTLFLNIKTLLSLVQNNVVSKKHLVVQIILKIHSAKEVLRLRVKFPKTFFSVKVSEKQDCPYFLMQ